MIDKEIEKSFYFGYGPNRSHEIMGAITGNNNLVGHKAVLQGYLLCVQKLQHVPDSILPTSPVPTSPRRILQTAWLSNFESYTIVKGKENDEVDGTVWELTQPERDLVREWELIDFGWSQDIKGEAVTKEGEKIAVVTEGMRDGQNFDRIVDGKKYKTLPVPLQDLKHAINKCRKEYFERIISKHIEPF